jgi:hypothetical protein
MLLEWTEHCNRARVHMALGPGIPDPPKKIAVKSKADNRHRLPAGALVLAKSVLNGLHHEYSLATAPVAA